MPRFWYRRIFWETHVIHSTEDTNDLVLMWCSSRHAFIHFVEITFYLLHSDWRRNRAICSTRLTNFYFLTHLLNKLLDFIELFMLPTYIILLSFSSYWTLSRNIGGTKEYILGIMENAKVIAFRFFHIWRIILRKFVLYIYNHKFSKSKMRERICINISIINNLLRQLKPPMWAGIELAIT